MSFKLKINQKSLKLFISSFTCLSGVLVVASGWSDFQNNQVFEVTTHLNNQQSYRIIQRQFDRKIKHLPPDAKLIYEVNTANPNLKIILALLGMGLSILTLIAITEEDRLSELMEYINEKRIEAFKLDVDNEIAVIDYTKSEHLLIRASEEMAELAKNPHWIALQKNKEEILYGTQTEEETPQPQTPTDQELADIWGETVNETTAQDCIVCTATQARSIYELHKQGKCTLQQAIYKITEITPKHIDWETFKQQYIAHIREIKTDA